MGVINISIGFLHISEVSESHSEVLIHKNDIIIQIKIIMSMVWVSEMVPSYTWVPINIYSLC